jgi:hypothetical protein
MHARLYLASQPRGFATGYDCRSCFGLYDSNWLELGPACQALVGVALVFDSPVAVTKQDISDKVCVVALPPRCPSRADSALRRVIERDQKRCRGRHTVRNGVTGWVGVRDKVALLAALMEWVDS